MTEGGCHCGQIRFRAEGAPDWVVGCSCRDCARLAGAPFVVMAGFSPNNITFETEPAYRESSPGVIRGACPTCHSQITYGRAEGYENGSALLYLMVAAFDDPDAHPPEEVVWYDTRPAWFELETPVPLHGGVSDVNAHRSYATVLSRKR